MDPMDPIDPGGPVTCDAPWAGVLPGDACPRPASEGEGSLGRLSPRPGPGTPGRCREPGPCKPCTPSCKNDGIERSIRVVLGHRDLIPIVGVHRYEGVAILRSRSFRYGPGH